MSAVNGGSTAYVDDGERFSEPAAGDESGGVRDLKRLGLISEAERAGLAGQVKTLALENQRDP